MKKILSLFIALLLIAALAIVPASAERYSVSAYSIEVPSGWTHSQEENILYLYGPDGIMSGYVMLNVQDFSDYAFILSSPDNIQAAAEAVISGLAEGLGTTVGFQYEWTVAGVTGRAFSATLYGMPLTGWVAFNGTDCVAVIMMNVDESLIMLETLQIAQ